MNVQPPGRAGIYALLTQPVGCRLQQRSCERTRFRSSFAATFLTAGGVLVMFLLLALAFILDACIAQDQWVCMAHTWPDLVMLVTCMSVQPVFLHAQLLHVKIKDVV